MVELTQEMKREIGQHFVFGFHGYDLSEDIITLIRDYYLGNVILMKRNVQSIQQVHSLIQKLQALARDSGHSKPLMIGIDQENGLVSAFSSTATYEAGTQFPGAMTLAATGSIELVEKVTAASAGEMRLAGINWAYSPVADVNSDPRNPVIGVRSFGDDPEEVGKYVCAVSRGLTSEKVAPCAKHFPGHGDTDLDSHLSLPSIAKSKDALLATELVPFRALVDAGIASIMTAHIALPLVTGDNTPASLSRVINTNLLREEMQYEGIIVTDCLEMDGVNKFYGAAKGAVMSLQAGADIVMICHRIALHIGALEETYGAVERGQLSLSDIRKSGERIAKFKDRFAGTWENVLDSGLDVERLPHLKAENATLSRKAYASSTALIRDPHGALPFNKDGHPIVLFTPQMESLNLAVDDAEGVLRTADGKKRNTAGPSYLSFAKTIGAHAGSQCVHIVYDPQGVITPDTTESVSNATHIIFATRNADRSVWQIDFLHKLRAAVKTSTKLALVSSCAPYDLLNLEDVQLPCLATFEFTPPAFEAVTAAIFGEMPAVGRVPVKGRKTRE